MDKLREVDWRGMVKTATQKVWGLGCAAWLGFEQQQLPGAARRLLVLPVASAVPGKRRT